MKKILLISFFAVLLSCISCNEKLIDIPNPNSPTTETFWKTPSDAQLGLDAVYNMFYKPGTWTRWIYFRYDLTSDEGYSQSPWNELKEWTRFIYFNYNFWEGNAWMWRDHYKAIFRCNQVLTYVPDIQFSNAADKDKVLAQAKFLRAFYYYNLAIMFDNVPLVLGISAPGDSPKQNTEAEVFAQIVLDLNDAVKSLPEKWGDNDLGRPTKGAALALLGKTYMQMRDWVPLYEGFLTYGGMSVREIEAMAVGLNETLDFNVISHSPTFIKYLVDALDSKGIPVITPSGGLGCHLDAGQFLSHIPQTQYPAGALAAAMYICSGIRGMERGTISSVRDENGDDVLADVELLRLAFPRRVFTLSQIKYAEDRIQWLYDNRELVGGLEWTEEPPVLRFFVGKLKPIGDWVDKLVAKFRADFGDSL